MPLPTSQPTALRTKQQVDMTVNNWRTAPMSPPPPAVSFLVGSAFVFMSLAAWVIAVC